jgi:hypothetical protein
MGRLDWTREEYIPEYVAFWATPVHNFLFREIILVQVSIELQNVSWKLGTHVAPNAATYDVPRGE